MSFVILLILILINGVFALSEFAIVSSRKARLRTEADKGNSAARTALALTDDPDRFLSTVQIGITLVGISSGAVGGSAIAGSIGEWLTTVAPSLEPYANQIGFAIIVSLTTYLSLVIGELVPKRIALHNPERAALAVAGPMRLLSVITAPLVWILSRSTALVTGLLGIRGEGENSVSDFEIIAMMREGAQKGVFDTEEHYMVKGALELDDIDAITIATPRPEIVWLEKNASQEELRAYLAGKAYTAYPICEGNIDNVVGVVRSRDLLAQLLGKGEMDLSEIMYEPLFVPGTLHVSKVLTRFRHSHVNIAIVVGEYGGVRGLLTLHDIIEEVIGDIDMEDPQAIQQQDGSWMLDGGLPTSVLRQMFPNLVIPEEERNEYHTLAGFLMTRMGRVPDVADQLNWDGYRFQVEEMKGQRIRRVKASVTDPEETIQSPDEPATPSVRVQTTDDAD